MSFLLSAHASLPSPIEKQWREADLVVMGRALGNRDCPGEYTRDDCILVGNLVYLKHDESVPAAETILTFRDIGIREDRADCCRVGQVYLMFLVHHEGQYSLYRGKWSVLRVTMARKGMEIPLEPRRRSGE
jgi:hypothetical protein